MPSNPAPSSALWLDSTQSTCELALDRLRPRSGALDGQPPCSRQQACDGQPSGRGRPCHAGAAPRPAADPSGHGQPGQARQASPRALWAVACLAWALLLASSVPGLVHDSQLCMQEAGGGDWVAHGQHRVPLTHAAAGQPGQGRGHGHPGASGPGRRRVHGHAQVTALRWIPSPPLVLRLSHNAASVRAAWAA